MSSTVTRAENLNDIFRSIKIGEKSLLSKYGASTTWFCIFLPLLDS